MIRLLNWLLTPTGYFLASAQSFDELLYVAVTSERARLARRVADAEQQARDARDWALFHLLEELGPSVEKAVRARWTH